jgi:rhodanese-related sulfurtransferase
MRGAILAALLFAIASAGSPASAGDVSSVQPEELLAALKAKDQKILVLDVRSDEEYAAGHVPGAVHIPYDQLESRIEEVRVVSAERIVVYCESGRRAGKAEAILTQAGFENVEDLDGHMKGWRSDKRPTKRPLSEAPKD